jgi:hypothetical protein
MQTYNTNKIWLLFLKICAVVWLQETNANGSLNLAQVEPPPLNIGGEAWWGQSKHILEKSTNFFEVISRNFNEKFKSAPRKCGNIFPVWTNCSMASLQAAEDDWSQHNDQALSWIYLRLMTELFPSL